MKVSAYWTHFLPTYDYLIEALLFSTVDLPVSLIEADKIPKRAPKMFLKSCDELRDVLGPLFERIETHFHLRRPHVKIALDANLKSLRQFFTILEKVS